MPVNRKGIMHCYSGAADKVNRFIDLGYYIGVGGPITRYEEVQKAVMNTPIDRIVIETDAPVLPPLPYEKHERNNSMYLKYVVNKIAEIKNISEQDVINYTTQNACKVYGIDGIL
jgi:TatD DNase family protein